MIDVYIFRGTGEPLGTGMCYQFTNRLNKSLYNVIEIEYPATIGPVGSGVDGVSLDKSVETAKQLFFKSVADRDNKVALVGYSLGALAATRILEDIASAEMTVDPVFAVLIANPARNAGDSALNMCNPKHSGIHSQHLPFPKNTHVIELANGYDMITAADSKSPIRLISKLISPFEIVCALESGSDQYDLIKLLREVQHDDWLAWTRPHRYIQAMSDIVGYIVPWGIPLRTQHTLYNLDIMPGTGKTWIEWAVSEVTQRFG